MRNPSDPSQSPRKARARRREDEPAEVGLDGLVEALAGVGPKRAEQLARVGVHTVRDLLFALPFEYFDRTRVAKIREVRPEENATLLVTVRQVKLARTRSGKRTINVVVDDETGQLSVWFFNREYLVQQLPPGTRMILSGTLRFYDGLRMAEPEFEVLPPLETPAAPGTGLHTLGIVPHYRLTEGLPEKWLRARVRAAVDAHADRLEDTLPPELRVARGLVDAPTAIRDAHFPPSLTAKDAAVRRLAYEELLHLQCLLEIRRRHGRRREAAFTLRADPALDERIRARFPFRFTTAQDRVVAEIAGDLGRAWPMNRLLQGDVGSGKTAVALWAALATIAAGRQAVIMAPTEILARQHFETFGRLLEGSRVRHALLVGGIDKVERREIVQGLFAGEIDLVVGTHALIEEDVAFAALGLVVIDEQHRFGVLQRALLRRKGPAPHVLVMTATPIPRTLAMTVFGDLDVSTIDELPPGRKPVRTHVRTREKFIAAMEFAREKLREGRQCYFISPVIEDSDRLQLRSATHMHQELSRTHFEGFPVALLTGQTEASEKERIMAEFRAGKIAVLVSTVVIEVGIDVPNATIMVVDHADRFGLAQLHQLRGRIGRGGEQAHCILFSDGASEEGERRLKVLEETSDGFRIAEADLGFRGPGEFLGTRQSGLPEFKVARLERDFALLREARADAIGLLAQDPTLVRSEHAAFRNALCARYEEVRTLAGE